jgi:hypothetical protein
MSKEHKPMSIDIAMVKLVEMAIQDFKVDRSWIDKIEINPVKKHVRFWFGSEFGRSRPITYTFDEEKA